MFVVLPVMNEFDVRIYCSGAICYYWLPFATVCYHLLLFDTTTTCYTVCHHLLHSTQVAAACYTATRFRIRVLECGCCEPVRLGQLHR